MEPGNRADNFPSGFHIVPFCISAAPDIVQVHYVSNLNSWALATINNDSLVPCPRRAKP